MGELARSPGKVSTSSAAGQCYSEGDMKGIATWQAEKAQGLLEVNPHQIDMD